MMSWQSNDNDTLKLHNVDTTDEAIEYNGLKFDLELELYEQGGEIVGGLDYSTALFDRDTIERHVGYLESMLRWMTNGTEDSISTAPILGMPERELLLETWNRTEQPFPGNRCLHQLFEDQVEVSPEAVAVVHDEQTLAYRELNSLANRIACQLIDAGVRPGDYIMLLLDRSIALVASQIAVLKIGAAYVPIDTRAPVGRQAYIASDCRSKILITDERTDVPPGILATVICVSTMRGNAEHTQVNSEGLAISSSDTAYIMYTSGSTGLPKGVLVPHRTVAALLMNQQFKDISPDDRIAFVNNPAFDPSTSDVWGPLLHGARIVIIDNDTCLDPYRLGDALERHQITSLETTSALFHQFAFTIGHAFSRLRYINSGGEQGLVEPYNEVLRNGGPVRLINTYGPTETTVTVTSYEATSQLSKLDRVPIGRPICNAR
ncbi:hypothetical protein BGZ68_003523, partial [Mortierella alpina]